LNGISGENAAAYCRGLRPDRRGKMEAVKHISSTSLLKKTLSTQSLQTIVAKSKTSGLFRIGVQTLGEEGGKERLKAHNVCFSLGLRMNGRPLYTALETKMHDHDIYF